jgi:hypothetical protein
MTDTAAGTNGYDADKLKKYLDPIEREQDKLDALKIDHLNSCKGPRERIKKVIKAAREDDINIEAFRILLQKRMAERKHAKRVAELEEDDADAYGLMEQALGEYGTTPLGQAALSRARGGKRGGSLDSLKQ